MFYQACFMDMFSAQVNWCQNACVHVWKDTFGRRNQRMGEQVKCLSTLTMTIYIFYAQMRFFFGSCKHCYTCEHIISRIPAVHANNWSVIFYGNGRTKVEKFSGVSKTQKQNVVSLEQFCFFENNETLYSLTRYRIAVVYDPHTYTKQQ